MLSPEVQDPSRAEGPACTILDWIAVFFAGVVTAVAGSLVGRAVGGEGSLAETCGGLIGLWCAIVPGAILLSRVRGTGNLANDFGLRIDLRRDWTGLLVGVASQLLMLPAIYAVIQLFLDRNLADDLKAPAEELTNQADPGLAFAFLAVLLIVGAPIVEELFYRGMLFGALRRYLAPVFSIVLSGAVFGAAHFQPLLFAGLAAFGIVLAVLRERSGHLGSSILAHAAFNAITVTALALR